MILQLHGFLLGRNPDHLAACPAIDRELRAKRLFRRHEEARLFFNHATNLVPDAHLAALLRHHGVKRLYTHDRDFLKFPFLDVRDPLA